MRHFTLVSVVIRATILFSATDTSSQEHFAAGSHVRVSLLEIKPTKGGDFWRDQVGPYNCFIDLRDKLCRTGASCR